MHCNEKIQDKQHYVCTTWNDQMAVLARQMYFYLAA